MKMADRKRKKRFYTDRSSSQSYRLHQWGLNPVKPTYDPMLADSVRWQKYRKVAALKFCFKTCVAMKFVDDDDDDQ